MNIAKILILDDEKELLENLIYDLDDYDIYPITRTKEAIALANQDSFDCIITDLKIPEKDGFYFIEELKKTAPDTPVIVMTAHGDETIYKKAKEMGVIDFINKPYSREDLLYLIKDILEDNKKEAI